MEQMSWHMRSTDGCSSKFILISWMYFFTRPDFGSFMVYTTAIVGGRNFRARFIGIAGISRPSRLGTA